MKIAFIIWTPLHLFNTARFIISNNLVGECDAFYVCQSEPMKDYYLSAMDNNFFHKIYFANYDSIKVNQKKWEMISVIISPKLYIERIFGKDAVGNTYDMMFMSVPTRLNDAIIRANNCKKIIGYDDGTGSYIKDLYSRSLGRKYELAKRMKKIPNYCINDIYLNSPELAPKDSNKNYYKLVKEELNEENVSLLNSLFSFKKEKSISRFIYLNQPIKEITSDNDYVIKEKEIANIII